MQLQYHLQSQQQSHVQAAAAQYHASRMRNGQIRCICDGKETGSVIRCGRGAKCVGAEVYHTKCVGIPEGSTLSYPWICTQCTSLEFKIGLMSNVDPAFERAVVPSAAPVRRVTNHSNPTVGSILYISLMSRFPDSSKHSFPTPEKWYIIGQVQEINSKGKYLLFFPALMETSIQDKTFIMTATVSELPTGCRIVTLDTLQKYTQSEDVYSIRSMALNKQSKQGEPSKQAGSEPMAAPPTAAAPTQTAEAKTADTTIAEANSTAAETTATTPSPPPDSVTSEDVFGKASSESAAPLSS